jgi:hypothetical protein
MKKLMLSLVVLALALAGAAFAQGNGKPLNINDKFDIQGTFYNPCPPTPEGVQMAGTGHFSAHISPPDSEKKFAVIWSFQVTGLKGTGLTTGQNYTAHQSSHGGQSSGVEFPIEVAFISHFRIGDYSERALYRYAINQDWSVTFTRVTFSYGCKSR